MFDTQNIHALDVAGEAQGEGFGQAALWGHRAEQELGWLRIWEFGHAWLRGKQECVQRADI